MLPVNLFEKFGSLLFIEKFLQQWFREKKILIELMASRWSSLLWYENFLINILNSFKVQRLMFAWRNAVKNIVIYKNYAVWCKKNDENFSIII